MQCEPDEASSFTNPNVGPDTYAGLKKRTGMKKSLYIMNLDFKSIFRLIINVSVDASLTLRNSDSESSAFGKITKFNPFGING